MSDLKPANTKITLGNKEYSMRFTLNTIDDIQDKFNISIKDLPKLLNQNDRKIYKNITEILAILINEGIDCDNDENGKNENHINARYVGRYMDVTNNAANINAIYAAFGSGIPESDEDESPNVTSE